MLKPCNLVANAIWKFTCRLFCSNVSIIFTSSHSKLTLENWIQVIQELQMLQYISHFDWSCDMAHVSLRQTLKRFNFVQHVFGAIQISIEGPHEHSSLSHALLCFVKVEPFWPLFSVHATFCLLHGKKVSKILSKNAMTNRSWWSILKSLVSLSLNFFVSEFLSICWKFLLTSQQFFSFAM